MILPRGAVSWSAVSDCDISRSYSLTYGVYISRLIRFARVCSNTNDFNNINQFLTVKMLKQGYQYNKLRKTVSKFEAHVLRFDCFRTKWVKIFSVIGHTRVGILR